MINLLKTSCFKPLSHLQLSATLWTAACQASILYQLLELVQTHIHRVGDAIQSSHPVVPSPPAFNLSQHQGLVQ